MRDLLKALRRLKVETGSLACLGCGHEHNCATQGCAILRAAIEEIEAIPAVDAVEARHGRWEYKETGPEWPHHTCSECKHIGKQFYDFCPWCGARMDGKEDHNGE